jgi:DNA-binding GntR family transcriptional regulator
MTISRPLTGSGLRPINQKSSVPVREQTVQILREAILNFELRPGQRLIEREFIDRLGISRTTFREALRQLSTEGLVTVIAQKGARVSTPTKKEAADLYEIRAALESLMVTRFIERASDGEIKALSSTVDDFEDVVRRTTDTIELLEVKERFYRVLLDGAHSPALEQVLAGIKARVRALRSTSLSKPGRANETVNELRAVVVAIARRDSRDATELNYLHVQRACAIALSQLPGPDLEEPESAAS